LPANWSASQTKQSTSEARRISLEETVRFERIHEETYRDFGFDLVSVEPGSVVERVSMIKAAIR
jgi:predicted ATPase